MSKVPIPEVDHESGEAEKVGGQVNSGGGQMVEEMDHVGEEHERVDSFKAPEEGSDLEEESGHHDLWADPVYEHMEGSDAPKSSPEIPLSEEDSLSDGESIFLTKKPKQRSTSPGLRQGETSITAFYPRLTQEENRSLLMSRTLKRKREDEDQCEEQEQAVERTNQVKLAKACTGNNQCKKKQRANEREDEIERGIRDIDGNKKKKKNITEPVLDGSNDPDGEALPFQAIYKGKTKLSLPAKPANMESNGDMWKRAEEIGFLFEFSRTDTYWSTLEMMKSYVDNILAPYFVAARAAHGDPANQLAIWQIDAWSIHRSAEFCAWMAKNHPCIQLKYVPGGCTGIWQPCDVGIQRVLKHELHRMSHADVVAEALWHLEALEANGSDDRSVRWLVRAYDVVNHPEFVRKAFEHCQLDAEPHFNLSQASLTSTAALQALKNLPTTDPQLWAEISQGRADQLQLTDRSKPDPSSPDDKDEEQELGDDLSIPTLMLCDHILTGGSTLGRGFVENDKGRLAPVSISEMLDDAAADTDHEFTEDTEGAADVEAGPSEPAAMGCGKQAKKPNQFYTVGKKFWEQT
ncbi:hypothetical protein EWM64_g4314 [Hericium alpestre]|uniref:DDE-1 domain-containing protein n=1 Tax=Hericium alpestre TaxID=135208 RepID=A0A4Z0A040_9AGAM|nr:hypothetical protein EWM64_g4314 [Hericium alpestre]